MMGVYLLEVFTQDVLEHWHTLSGSRRRHVEALPAWVRAAYLEAARALEAKTKKRFDFLLPAAVRRVISQTLGIPEKTLRLHLARKEKARSLAS